jgi:hypothetical protein
MDLEEDPYVLKSGIDNINVVDLCFSLSNGSPESLSVGNCDGQHQAYFEEKCKRRSDSDVYLLLRHAKSGNIPRIISHRCADQAVVKYVVSDRKPHTSEQRGHHDSWHLPMNPAGDRHRDLGKCREKNEPEKYVTSTVAKKGMYLPLNSPGYGNDTNIGAKRRTHWASYPQTTPLTVPHARGNGQAINACCIVHDMKTLS